MPALFDSDFIRKLEMLAVLAKKILRGEYSATRLHSRKGASVEFADHRMYSTGDDLRYIDWNAYGRLEALYIKQFASEENVHIHIALDSSASMNYGAANKFDMARKIAAALAYVGTSNFDEVELSAFGPSDARTFSLGSRAQVRAMLDYLSELRCAAADRLLDTLPNPAVNTRMKKILFLVSDFLQPPQALADCLKQYALRKWQIAGVQILDSTERLPTVRGLSRLVDSETGTSLRADCNQAALDRYTELFSAHEKEVERLFKQRAHAWVQVDSHERFEDAVLKTLRMSGILTGRKSY